MALIRLLMVVTVYCTLALSSGTVVRFSINGKIMTDEARLAICELSHSLERELHEFIQGLPVASSYLGCVQLEKQSKVRVNIGEKLARQYHLVTKTKSGPDPIDVKWILKQIGTFKNYRNALRQQSPLVTALKKADSFAQRAVQPLPFLWRSHVTRSRGMPPIILRQTKYIIAILKSSLFSQNATYSDRVFTVNSSPFSLPSFYSQLDDAVSALYAVSRTFCTYVQNFYDTTCPILQ